MRKNYNYTRQKLYLPEYGRHIHEMIDSLLRIEDRAERTRQAKAVIAVMGNLNPLLRDTADFKHKLWDHLFIMSDFKLDVDSPYPQPSRQDLELKPKKLRYTQSRIAFKHYTATDEEIAKIQEGDVYDWGKSSAENCFHEHALYPDGGELTPDHPEADRALLYTQFRNAGYRLAKTLEYIFAAAE